MVINQNNKILLLLKNKYLSHTLPSALEST